MRRNSVSLSVIPEMLLEVDDDRHQFFCAPRAHIGDHPSLNRVLSSLFDSSAIATPPHLQQGLQSSMSSAALLSEANQLCVPPLRKSSSAVDWSGVLTEAGRKTSFQQLDWSTHLGEVTRKQAVTQPHLLSRPAATHAPTDDAHQGGLVMSTASDRKQMAVPISQHLAPSPFTQHLASGSSSSSGHSTPSSANPLEPSSLHHDEQRKHNSMLGNMFKSGFFARPVVRTEEENYRYMMALDR